MGRSGIQGKPGKEVCICPLRSAFPHQNLYLKYVISSWLYFFSLGLLWSFRLNGRSRNPRTKGFLLHLFQSIAETSVVLLELLYSCFCQGEEGNPGSWGDPGMKGHEVWCCYYFTLLTSIVCSKSWLWVRDSRNIRSPDVVPALTFRMLVQGYWLLSPKYSLD